MKPRPPSCPHWFWLVSGSGPAAENMAWDEALLEHVQRLGGPVLRHYGWMEPAASFGYFQKSAEIERMTSLRPLVRRPTGGGLVPHDADWTYSLAFAPGDPWHELKAAQSYRQVHEWIQRAFARLGVATQLSPCRREDGPGQCFVGAEQFDLLWQDRKIAGAAQRRTRHGLLVQGSIQPPPRVPRIDFEQAMRDQAISSWGVEWRRLDPDAALEERVLELARDRYANPAHHRRR